VVRQQQELRPTLKEDIKVRVYLQKKLSHASVGKITIERPAKNARITIHSARPGVVIGKKGEDIETLRADLRKMMGGEVGLNIEEIRKPEIDASSSPIRSASNSKSGSCSGGR
jgi:small subunit ribosomal protein S3